MSIFCTIKVNIFKKLYYAILKKCKYKSNSNPAYFMMITDDDMNAFIFS